MIHVAVISDTHDHVPPGLTERIARADEIWHLGDVCEMETFNVFKHLGPPLHVVLGNNESHMRWPEELVLERHGHRFYLTHIPPTRVPPRCGFVLHGHTHVPRDETDALGVRWLNPGCITRPNRQAPPSFAWLVIEPGQKPTWKLELV